MTTAVILKFQQVGQEEYRTIPYTKKFRSDTTLYQILQWVKSIDDKKTIKDVYFNDVDNS
jgi:hypothetical protein